MTREPIASDAVRVKTAFGVALAILGLAGAAAYRATFVSTETTAWVEHTHEVLDHLSAERAALTEAELVRRVLASGTAGDWPASYQHAMEVVVANGRAVRELTADNPAQQRRLDELEALLEANAGRSIDARVDALLSELTSEELRLLALRRQERRETIAVLRVAEVAGTVFSFAILLLAFRQLRRESAKRASSERAATESEKSLARILMSIGDGVIVTDAKGLVVRMNRVAEELTGRSARDGIGRDAAETFRVIDAQNRVTIADPVARRLTTKATLGLARPWLLVRKDGRELPISESCALVRDDKGAVQGAVLVFRDESEAKRAKALFRALVEKSSDGIALTSQDGTLLYASPAVARILGRADEDVLGTNVVDSAYPDDVEALRAFNRALAEKPGMTADTKRRVRRPDGTCRWVEVIGTNMMDDPAVGGIVRNMRDITERKAAEEALVLSETQFARLSESGLVGIARVDAAGGVHDANDAYLKMLGWSRADLLAGKLAWASMIPPEWLDASARANEQLQSNHVLPPWESELFRRDGSRIAVLVGAAMLDRGSYLTFVVDLTDRKRTEKALRETETQLRQAQKMEAVGRLAGGVAHDFNNLLSVILSYCAMLLDDLETTNPMHGDVDEIRKAGVRAAELTHQLLLFSRHQVIEPKVVDVNDVLSELDKMVRRLLGEDIEITLSKRSTAKVLVDPSGIEQVVMNLVVNARDAMPTGGKITIETADVVLDEEYARHHVGVSPGPHVMLAVTDDGTGMDAATQARIFEPFFTTKEHGKGTGLGLATVFGIVTQSGGSIWVYSEIGLGTTFKIYLPRATTDVRAATISVAPPTLRGDETILLVEDEAQVRVVARGILTRAGYKVIDAATAGEALVSCEQHTGAIHLLLTDVVMPQMSGPQLAKRLAEARPAMRVLCMSGYTDDSIVRHGVLDDRFAFLQKPITPETLTRKVREVLDAVHAES